MTRAAWAASFVLFLAAAPALAAEPLSGRWLLKSQEVDGKKSDPDPLTLRIIPSGAAFEFAYSLPVNNVQFLSMKFVSRLDGAEADVTNAQGNKIGTIKVKRGSRSEYSVILQGPGRPTATGKMSVSADGKTLTSESDSIAPNGAKTHMVQVFALQQP